MTIPRPPARRNHSLLIPIDEIIRRPDIVESLVRRVGSGIEIPLLADSQDHRIARVALEIDRPRDIDLWFAAGILVARERLAIDTGSQTDVCPVTIEHPKLSAVMQDVRRLQTTLSLAERGIGLHGNAP